MKREALDLRDVTERGFDAVAAPTALQIVLSATANEIDMEAFDTCTRARSGHSEGGTRPGTDGDLRDASVCAEVDGILRPTFYGLMVFGRRPQRYSGTISLFVQCARYAGLDRAARPVSVGEAKGRLEDQIDRAMGWFRSLGHREEYHGIQAIGGGAPQPRNEMMANAMVVQGRMRGRGRGWPLMRKEMREFNGTEPELINEVAGRYVRVRFLTPLETEAGSSE